jgi:GT2 family glycosyltransferase
MDVSVIITCWNGKDLLSKNLPLVFKAAGNKANHVSEIIVVDDGSTDDSVGYLKENFPKIRVVENKKNYGYAYTCNQGVRAARADLVAILNLDVIPETDFLVSCLPCFEDNKVFSVSFNESSFGPGKLEEKKGFIEIIATRAEKEISLTDWPSGGSSVFRKNMWLEIGGMDEIFLPFYFEDVDLGIRARKRGYRCLWNPKAKIVHKHEQTINPNNFAKHKHRQNISLIKERNYLLLNWKNLDKSSEVTKHLIELFKRCFSQPGYIKILFLAVLRKLFFLFNFLEEK